VGEGRGALPHTLPAFSEKAGEKDKTFGFVRYATCGSGSNYSE